MPLRMFGLKDRTRPVLFGPGDLVCREFVVEKVGTTVRCRVRDMACSSVPAPAAVRRLLGVWSLSSLSAMPMNSSSAVICRDTAPCVSANSCAARV